LSVKFRPRAILSCQGQAQGGLGPNNTPLIEPNTR
jgi:hypothetical protein